MTRILTTLAIISFIAILMGCSFASYEHITPASSIKVSSVRVGSDGAFQGLDLTSGDISLSVNDANVTQTKGFKAAVEGAVSAVLKAVIP